MRSGEEGPSYSTKSGTRILDDCHDPEMAYVKDAVLSLDSREIAFSPKVQLVPPDQLVAENLEWRPGASPLQCVDKDITVAGTVGGVAWQGRCHVTSLSGDFTTLKLAQV